MKSLKRTLSLVLVLVMVLGLFGVASAAFTDDAKIQYKEAVEVMTGIGAINGYTDGSFNPAGTITRAEAAKLVAYTILGAETAAGLGGMTSRFTDVGADYAWAIPSIEYLASKGIINGLGDGTFNPEGNVTGYELGKMLLVANGFGKNGEYVGDDWALNVAIDANKENVKLFAGRVSTAGKLSDAATREEAALYCFNAIQYSPSGSSSERIYGITGWEKVGEQLVPKYGWIEVPVVAKDSIMASVYPTLKNNAKGTDDLGRPSNVWTYTAKNTPISTTTIAPVATFSKEITQNDLYKALGAGVTGIKVTVNSKNAQTTNTTVDAVKNGTAKIPNSGNGVISELYKTEDGLFLVQIVPTVDTISSIVPTRASASRGAYNTYNLAGGANGRVFTSVVDPETDVNTAIITGTVAKDDTVLYFKGANGLYIQAVGTVSGLVTSITQSGVITIGSTQTAKAEAYVGTEPTVNGLVEQSYYVDSFGYLIAPKSTTTSGDKAALILGYDSYSELKDGKIVTTYVAALAMPDGTVSTVNVVKDDFDNKTGYGTVAKYTVDTKGVYNIGDAAGTAVAKLETGKAEVASNKFANSATKFVVANFAYNADKNDRVPTGTVTVYTGIANVPTYASLSAAWAVDTDNNNIVETVFIFDDIGATAKDNYVYVIPGYTQTAEGYVLNTITKGQAGTIVLKDLSSGNNGIVAAGGLFSQISVTGGEATATKATTTIDKIGNVGNLLFTSTDGGATYTYAGKSIADSTPVFTIYESAPGYAPSVDVGTAASLVNPVTVTDGIHVVYGTGAAANSVAAVYIVYPYVA